MKHSHLFAILCILAMVIPSVNAQQRTLTITGDTCEGKSLKAILSSGMVKQFRWFKDTVLLQARGAWQRYGTVVAGGNGAGSAANQLYDPHGVFVDKDNNIYIVDNFRVQKWAPGAQSGVTVAGGTNKGTSLNEFYAPVDVFVDNNKNVYVSDYLTNRVVKWAPGATSGIIVAGATEQVHRQINLMGRNPFVWINQVIFTSPTGGMIAW